MLMRAIATIISLLTVTGTAVAGYVNNQPNQAWAALRDQTTTEFAASFATNSAAGYRMIDVDAYPNGSGRLYSQIWERNTDTRGWVENRDMTSAQFAARWTELAAAGYRMHDFDSYLSGSTQLYAGIWVRNVEGWSWSSRRDMTGVQYADYFATQAAAGRRPVDIEVYQTVNGLRYAAIWYQNAGNVPWSQLRDMTRTTYQSQLKIKSTAGYRPIDFESYMNGSTQLYAVIWERNPAGRSFVLRSDRTELQYTNYARQYSDEGYRLIDFERYNTPGGTRYAGLWVENDSRFDYPRKTAIDGMITALQDAEGLPGISVAVIRDGSVIYRTGFGFAHKGSKIAHSETVYNAASVSKVIGGTLAAKLEAEGRLRDGRTVSLDLTARTSSYLRKIPWGLFSVSIPSFHTHTVDQLLSHRGCVAYYDSEPRIGDQTTHYPTAVSAVRSIWDVRLVTDCTVGTTRLYSTAAFTFVGAVLERVTGRAIHQLITSELAVPYNLHSLRVKWEDPVLPPNFERASLYNPDNSQADHQDTSWKVLGGGLELNAVDLASFGWKVLSAQIVTAAVRDNRLWTPVHPNCPPPVGEPDIGQCDYGLAWRLLRSEGRRVAEHSGSQTGTQTFLQIYRDKALVVAVMSNRNEEEGEGCRMCTLAKNIANEVLLDP